MMYLQITLMVATFFMYWWSLYRAGMEQKNGDYIKAIYEMTWAILMFIVFMSLL